MSKNSSTSSSNTSSKEDEKEGKKELDHGLELEEGTNLKDLLQNEGVLSYDPVCVRKRSNWSQGLHAYKFDHDDFTPEVLLKDIPSHSPKLNALLAKITDLDKKDQQKYGKKFKHFIFSDLKSSTYGAKLLASAFLAMGWKLGYTAKRKVEKKKSQVARSLEEDAKEVDEEDEEEDEEEVVKRGPMIGGENSPKEKKPSKKRFDKIELLSDADLLKTRGDNFFLLSSVAVYDQPINVPTKKAILQTFNKRPDNIQGDLARIIIMDSGYKEGIDLFDIKYIHIFEPSVVGSDQKQVIGRGTRTCGQKGLDFHPRRGWPLYVFIYDLSIPESLNKHFLGVESAIDLYLKAMNIDIRLFHLSHDIEKNTVFGSVDYELNKNIHLFSIPDEDDEEELPEGSEFVYGGSSDKNGVGNFENQSVTSAAGTSIVGGGPKVKLVIRNKMSRLGYPRQEERLGFQAMRQHIHDHFSEFTWDHVKMENLCADKQAGGASGEVIKYTPTQDFIRHYFTPMNPLKGLLLYHGVGTGKTCAAIAAATSTFEKQGYTILWVTRTTLKNDIWKNMFDQVCNESIRHSIENSGLAIPEKQDKRMRLLSKSWRIRPMSYKQFSNLVSKQNAFYKTLVKLNGEADPLRKTLLIIDEAHKLYGGGDLSTIERPDMNALHQALMTSYQISGRDSVKLLLMTATPITQNPLEIVQLINLCKPIDEQMPTNFDDFSEQYLNEMGKFTEAGQAKYLDDIAGYVSYLNREKDARQFSQPQVEQVLIPIVNESDMETVEKFDKKVVRDKMESSINEVREQIIEKNKELEGELGDLDKNKFAFLKEEICGDLEGKPLKQCTKIVNANIREMLTEAKEEVKKIRASVKELRAMMKERTDLRKNALTGVKENQETLEQEYKEYKSTLFYSLKSKCAVKVSVDTPLKEMVKKHPAIAEFDREIEIYNLKIEELHNRLKLDVASYKARIASLKKILKTDLNDLERSVIKLTIRDEQKTQRSVMRIKKKEVSASEKELKKSLKSTQKNRNKRYKAIQKTIKKLVAEEKKSDKKKAAEAKKLRKTMRKNGELKEDIQHTLIQELVGKYKNRIIEDMVDLDKDLAEAAAAKEAKVTAKQKEKEDKAVAKQKEREAKAIARLDLQRTKKAEKEQLRKTKKANKEREAAEKKAKKAREAAEKKADKKKK